METVTDAQKLLGDVVKFYASLTSYADEGTVSRCHSNDPAWRIVFSTLFRKPSLFRCEFSRPHSHRPLSYVVSRHVAGFDGAAAYSLIQPHGAEPKIEARESLLMAVAAATGISGGSAHTIGRLLLPEVGGLSLLDFVDVRLRADTIIGSTACYCVTGRSPKGAEREFWVEKERPLLRRVRRLGGEFPSDEVRDNIRVNISLAAELFQSTL